MKYPMPIKKSKAEKQIEKKPSKYRNKKVTYNGIEFDSIKECERYKELKYLEKNELIYDLELQKEYILQDEFYLDDCDKKILPIKYKADFCYYESRNVNGIMISTYVVEDVKGVRTKEYLLKKKMFMKRYGMEIREV